MAPLKDVSRRLLIRTARLATSNEPVSRSLRRLGMHGLLPAIVWKRLPADRPFRVVVPGGDSFLYVGDDVVGIARPLLWRGLRAFEGETLSFVAELLVGARQFVDVGANTGVFTLLACAVEPGLEVAAFEPVPRIADRLRRNIDLNGWSERCDVQQAAVSDEVGHATLCDPELPLPTSARLLDAQYREPPFGRLVQVPLTTLDVAIRGRPVDLIKIDVEGAEDRVLRGMQRVVADNAPGIVVECLPEGPTERVEAFLRDHGYRIFHLTGRGPRPVARIVPDPARKLLNFAAVAREDHLERLSTLVGSSSAGRRT